MAQGTTDESVVYSVNGTHYFACRLRHILSLTALGKPAEQYFPDLNRRQAEFVNCLVNPRDERFTYDLRILSDPDPTLYTRGRITVALLCRLEDTVDEAENYARHLLNLLHSFFEEYEFELAGAEDIRRVLQPFTVRHLLAVTRRAGIERLDTLRSGPRRPRTLGFAGGEASVPESGGHPDAIFHIYPYLPTSSTFNGLCKLLLLERDPVAISCRLRPTTLTTEEEKYLEEQIARCETAAQAGLDRVPEDLSSIQPTLREQAKLYERYMARLLFGLKDNAALMTVEVASPGKIPTPLIDALGTRVTQPAGGMASDLGDGPLRYFAGGYEVRNRSEETTAIEGFGKSDMVISPDPLWAKEAARMLYLFDSVEATAAFRFPAATLEIPPGLPIKEWRSQSAPKDLPDEGCLLGVSRHAATGQLVRIGHEDRYRHLYVIGQTGTGKTTLMETMIIDDMRAGNGLCVIDPHGDLFKDLLGKVPAGRIKDVVLIDPTDVDYPPGLNMLEWETETHRHFLVQELVGIMTRLIEDEYGGASIGLIAGPVFLQHMRMNLLLAMSAPDDPGTLLEFYNIYQDKDFWKRWLPLKTQDPLLERWTKHVLPEMNYTKPGNEGVSMGGYVGSKFEAFVFEPALRRIFGQKRSTIDLRACMDEGKIILVNLAKGELTEENARFLGMVLLAKIMAAAMGRVRIPKRDRREFFLYVDEFQSLATQSFVTLLSEARKFGISLLLANQFLSQVKNPRIVQAIFGNVGTVICFRLGQADAELMEREFFPVFNRHDLLSLPNWQAYMTTLVNGQTVRPFSLTTLPDPTPYDEKRAAEIRKGSRSRYSRSRREVDKLLTRSFGTSTGVADAKR